MFTGDQGVAIPRTRALSLIEIKKMCSDGAVISKRSVYSIMSACRPASSTSRPQVVFGISTHLGRLPSDSRVRKCFCRSQYQTVSLSVAKEKRLTSKLDVDIRNDNVEPLWLYVMSFTFWKSSFVALFFFVIFLKLKFKFHVLKLKFKFQRFADSAVLI